MDVGKQSSFLINAVNQANVNCAPDCIRLLMTVVWQRHAGKHCISSCWPETVRRSFTPYKKCREAGGGCVGGVLSTAPSSPCSPNPDTSVWIAGSSRAELRHKEARFIHHLARFIFHERCRCARIARIEFLISFNSLTFKLLNVMFAVFFFT